MKWLGLHLLALYDRWNSRWANVWMNVAMLVLFLPVAIFVIEPGWARDMWFFAAGTFAGYTFMWLVAPRFNKARQREMEVEMAVTMAALNDLITRRTREFDRMLMGLDDNEKPGRLQ